MRLTIANLSTNISSTELNEVVKSLQEQVTHHFAPEWGREATVRGVRASTEEGRISLSGVHDAIIYLGDSSQDAITGVSNALGYHTLVHGKVPYGFVYLDICQEVEEPWTSTLSHEVLELLADPTASLTIAGPDPKGRLSSVARDVEVCDPTQGDNYLVLGKVLSNFVCRAYFGQPGGSGLTNYLGLDLKPFGVRPKGYFQYEDGEGPQQIQGALMTDRQRAAKDKLGKARRVQRRKDRFDLNARGVLAMSTTTTSRTLRQALAADAELRHVVQRAAATAISKVLDEAGLSLTPDDLTAWRADLAAMSPSDLAGVLRVQKEAGDVATGVLIGIATGF